MNNLRFSQSKGSSLLLRAHGSGGASATINQIAPQKSFRAKPKQAGKKEGGLGEGIFARLLFRAEGAVGVGSGGGFSVRRKAHKSVFPSLIENIFGRGARKRNEWKNAFVCSRRQAVRRRWAGLVRETLRVLLKVSSNLVQQTPPDKKLQEVTILLFAIFCLVVYI